MKPAYYVVLTKSGDRRLAKRTSPRANPELPGDLAEVGPFRTRRGAEYFRDRRGSNCVCVDDAETLAGKWTRVPSVNRNGAFFYVGTYPGKKLAVVQSPTTLKWRMHYGPDYGLRSGETFRTACEARKFADQFAYNYLNP